MVCCGERWEGNGDSHGVWCDIVCSFQEKPRSPFSSMKSKVFFVWTDYRWGHVQQACCLVWGCGGDPAVESEVYRDCRDLFGLVEIRGSDHGAWRCFFAFCSWLNFCVIRRLMQKEQQHCATLPSYQRIFYQESTGRNHNTVIQNVLIILHDMLVQTHPLGEDKFVSFAGQ